MKSGCCRPSGLLSIDNYVKTANWVAKSSVGKSKVPTQDSYYHKLEPQLIIVWICDLRICLAGRHKHVDQLGDVSKEHRQNADETVDKLQGHH